MSKRIHRLFFNNDQFYDRIVQTIATAQVEVCVEFYIFDFDPVGRRVLDALAEAVRRGVRAQLLVDGVGSMLTAREIERFCRKHNIEFKVFHPVPRFWSWRVFRHFGLLKRHLTRFARRINQRNHRKIVYIDGHTVFLGSLNATALHSESVMGALAWRDTGVSVELADKNLADPKPRGDFQALREAMDEAWRLARAYRRPYSLRWRRRTQRSRSIFRLNARVVWRFGHHKDLLERIRAAKSRILITNPYFLPKTSILRALRQAARRGVYVGLCLPERTDVWIVKAASRSIYPAMLKAGIHIFEYRPRVLHAKTLIIDDWGLVGSHNFNHRSFFHDLEIETPIEEPRLVDELTAQWEKDLRDSDVVTKDHFGKFAWVSRGIGTIIYLFRFWL